MFFYDRRLITKFALSVFMSLPASKLLADDNKNSSSPQEESISKDDTAYVMFEMTISKETMRALQDTIIAIILKGFHNICIMMNCSGGGISTSIAMYHFIIGLPANIDTYALSDIDSAGILIFLAGKERIANTGVVFGFHSGRHQFGQENANTAEIQEAQDSLVEYNKRMAEIIIQKTKLSKIEINNLLGPQIRSVLPQEALQMGIITKISELNIKKTDRMFIVVPPGDTDKF